ncbi:hypothetical protein Pori2_00046 [Pseudomonas phage vB_PpuP-Pori-2]
MRASQLAQPGRLRNAQDVRRSLAWLISQAEIAVARGQTPEAAFADIRAFISSASSYINTAAPVYTITATAPSPASILANNTATSSVTFNVKRNGVNMQSATVLFTKGGAQAATNTLSVASGVTDASGNVTVTLKGSAAGVGTVIGTTVNTGATVTVTSGNVTLT